MCTIERKQWNEKFVNYVLLRLNISKDNAMDYALSLNNAYRQGMTVVQAFERDWDTP